MHLILTHEQTDFDAVASLLAARLLDPTAIAVLPRRLNRNVRAYLTLYGVGFPLVEYSEVPKGKVESLTMVDTQNPPSVKGVGAHTKIHIIDHHPSDRVLDAAWSTHIETVGATTTLLVEALQDTGDELELAVATLLLLGIYEDTGSLSYPSTTPRDVRAAAWLLECGASLGVANDFLNHPLSKEQRQLFNRLFEQAETFVIQGLSIVIACGSTHGMVDEISTIAHKLRDLFDPDGLIVLVALDGGVQIVARSSNTGLNIARIAEHFGGGGHSQAAAALVRDRDIQTVKDEVLQQLGRVIQPTKTVGEIMSRGPQILSPADRIEEAAERMQRFGHEGYPVVASGKVVGLLTRHAVDRALTHGMQSHSVGSIMEAGNLTVSTHTKVQQLQRLMIQHGWGQIPVEDIETGEIIGIVTRTDVLKELDPDHEAPRHQDMARRLGSALPPDKLALLHLVAQLALQRGDALFIVGGFVRDLLLGAPSVDFDLVVEGDAIGLARALVSSYGGRVSSHRRFGTAKWQLDLADRSLRSALREESIGLLDLPASLDFVSARTEFYAHPTALPSVERGSIKLDLHRRDFTINTLALRLDGRNYGQLLDHWGGGRDIKDRLVRVLHSLSFIDDPTRMLRAVRLEQRLDFKIEARTLELLERALPLLQRVSGERIRSELELIFREQTMPSIMRRLDSLGLLGAIHHAIRWDAWLEMHFTRAGTFDPPGEWRLQIPPARDFLFYALLCFRMGEQEVAEVCARLSMPAGMAADIQEAHKLGKLLPQMLPGMPASAVVENLEGKREGAIVAAWLGLAGEGSTPEVLEHYLSEWRFVTPVTDGDDLRELGLPPGPEYGIILRALRSAWLDGQLQSEEGERVMRAALVDEVRKRG